MQNAYDARNSRLFPPFIMYEKVRSNCTDSFSIRLVPRFRFKNFGLVDERAVIAKHTFVWGEGQRCHKEMKERECGVRRDGVGVGDVDVVEHAAGRNLGGGWTRRWLLSYCRGLWLETSLACICCCGDSGLCRAFTSP